MDASGTHPLRIAMVLDAWDETNNGGVVSTRRFTELLRARGHQVTVVATGRPAPGKVVLPQFRIPIADGIMRKMRFPFAWPDRSILAAVFAAQDVVHVQFSFYLGMRAVALARAAGLPVVSTFHVQAEHLLHNVGIRSAALVDGVYRLFIRTVYDRTDRVVCPTAFAEQELRRHGLRAPTTVISNGVPPEYRPIPRSEWPDLGGRFVILSVGRLAREKRHDLLIEAIRRSRHEPRIQLVVIGDGPLRQRLEELGRSLTHPPRFLYLQPRELIPYYNAADLDVHAADVEVEGMSVLEAMACGAPCLIARAPLSAASRFALSEEFLFEAGAREELTARIDHWMERPQELQRARAAYRQAAEQYAIEASLSKLEAVYAEVTARAVPRRPLAGSC